MVYPVHTKGLDGICGVVCRSDLLGIACENILVRDRYPVTMCRWGVECTMLSTVADAGDCALQVGVLSLFCIVNTAEYMPYMKIEIF